MSHFEREAATLVAEVQRIRELLERPHLEQRSKKTGRRTSEASALFELVAPIVRTVLAETKSDVLMISQLNVEVVLGISSRAHLENCRRPDFTPKVIRAGKLRLVDALEYRAWLRSADSGKDNGPASDEQDPASAFLAELGLRERPARSKKERATGETRDLGIPKVG